MQLSAAASDGEANYAVLFDVVKDLILDENGVPVISDSETLPTGVLLAAIMAVVGKLGN